VSSDWSAPRALAHFRAPFLALETAGAVAIYASYALAAVAPRRTVRGVRPAASTSDAKGTRDRSITASGDDQPRAIVCSRAGRGVLLARRF